MTFAEFDLRPEILEALEAMGFKEPTAIQETVIPHILRGKDVSGLAQTGTGKTGAFVIPLLDRWLRSRDGEDKAERVDKDWKPNSYVLVLVPTRELATQVDETVGKLGAKTGVKTVVISGGNSYEDQKKALHGGVQFVVGTPGRLLDLYKSHDVDLNGVRAIVFDEADRMFDMGFKDDMKFILRRVPRNRQILMFSATLNFDVVNTAYQFGAEPIEFNVSKDQATAEGIEHEILHVGDGEKPMYLLSILKKLGPQQCIVFSNFKNNVGRIAKFLKNNGIEATAMSSLLSQAQRNKVLDAFKTGKKAILVATDVAARGLDIKGVDLVINYELPDDSEGYVHRIGRTGRAGTQGRAVGLVSDRDVEALQRIETYLKEKVKVGWYEDTELLKEFQPFPRFDDDEKKPFGPRPPRHGGDRSDRGPRGPKGPRGHHQRGPRNHDAPPRAQGAPHQAGAQANGEQRAFAGEHRDRRTGRHGQHGHQNTQGQQGQQSQNPRQGQHHRGGRPQHGQHRSGQQHKGHAHHKATTGQPQQAQSFKRRPLGKEKEAAAQQASGIGGKIKKFIKGLLG